MYNEAPLETKRDLKRCIASISVVDKNTQLSEAKCVFKAFSMADKEKTDVKWVGAFGVRRMKRRTKKQSRSFALSLSKVKIIYCFLKTNQNI